jgi:hypothetical protein
VEQRTRERLERVLDGYFDLRTAVLVERVLGAATPDELADPVALDALFDEFLELFAARYDRADAGWRESAEALLAAEWDRQLEAARAFERSLDDRAY